MDEDLEQKLVRLVADLSPEEYERHGPALRELGLALAELREVQLEVRNVRGIYEQA
jgi:nitric oxide reductase activation protein